jgi:DNA mismatch repair protein MutS
MATSKQPATVTPLMAQYFRIKKDHPEAVLFFQVGDFYELFFDDAVRIAEFLALTLTKRGKHDGKDIPLCGVPVHAINHYLTKLIKGGFSVAICDQVTKPIPGQVVEREVTQVLTPGTLVDEHLLDERSSSYLMAYASVGKRVGLVFAELLTSTLYVTEIDGDKAHLLETELGRFLPDEVIGVEEDCASSYGRLIKDAGFCLGQLASDPMICSSEWIDKKFSNNCFKTPATSKALGVLVAYLERNHATALESLETAHYYKPDNYLIIDRSTQKNLELITNQDGVSTQYTLVSVLDQTSTPMGARQLKNWILRPLVCQKAVADRHDVIEYFLGQSGVWNQVRKLLVSMPDIERMVGRIVLGKSRPRDYKGLARMLVLAPQIIKSVKSSKATIPALLESILNGIYSNETLKQYLEAALSDNDQELIKKGFDHQLDELRSILANAASEIIAYEQREVEATGISSLKVRYTDLFGYALEVTKTHYEKVPDYYKPHQTLSNRTRYMTDELKQLELKITTARQQITQIEQAVYERVQAEVASHLVHFRSSAQVIATLDVLVGFARRASEYSYVRADASEKDELVIEKGRHPVIEAALDGRFVPNDTDLSKRSSLWIITGPNMGGKSTYLRQVALITLMNQIGSYVPAHRARLPMVDRIFTRIGSGDDLAGGKSTFFVEMEETAMICREATEKSLVVLDEVGRGTSTYDGMALAQGIVEYLANQIKVKALFATHYHELTALAHTYPVLSNYMMDCRQSPRGLVFLHKLVPGIAPGSFGLEIAKKAEIPSQIINRAAAVLKARAREKEHSEGQLSLLAAPVLEPANSEHDNLIAELQALDLDNLSPREAHSYLFALHARLKSTQS